MKRTFGFLLAGALLISACGTTVDGTARAAGPIPPATDTQTSTAETTVSPTAEPSETASAEPAPTRELPPMPLPTTPRTGVPTGNEIPEQPNTNAPDGDATTAWVTTFCTALGEVFAVTDRELDGATLDETAENVADAYRDMAAVAASGAEHLNELAPPPGSGGEQLAVTVNEWLHTVNQNYGTGSVTIRNGTFETQAELRAAVAEIEGSFEAANSDLRSAIDEAGPDVQRALLDVPECGVLQ